jgi:hypothetical protein
MNRVLRIAALTLVFAAGTVFLDWSIVPVIASVYALLRRATAATVDAAVAAAVAWLVLIGRQASFPAFGSLLSTLGDIFPVPGVAIIGVAIALAAVLAASAARLSLGIVGVRDESSA